MHCHGEIIITIVDLAQTAHLSLGTRIVSPHSLTKDDVAMVTVVTATTLVMMLRAVLPLALT